VLSDTFTEQQWYINEKPAETEAWPRNTTQIVGERITNMTNPLVDYVVHLGSMPAYQNTGTNALVDDASKVYCSIYRRGSLYYSLENINTRGHILFDIVNPVSSRKTLSPVTHTYSDSYAGEPTSIINRLQSINNLNDEYFAMMVMHDAISISTNLRNALKLVGIGDTVTIPQSRARHLVLGTTKRSSGMIEHLDTNPATFYPKGYGYIAPVRTSAWNYADIENVNESTPWVATVKKYRADCNESTETRNMTLSAGTKQYDGYVGFATHKYLYGTKYTVSLALAGINPRTPSKDFYYYTVEGAGTSYYSQYTHWWDKRAPKNSPTTNIVEREYIGRVESTDANKIIGYNFREWLDNGTSREVTDYYNYYTKWFEITTSSTLAMPSGDIQGENLDQYTISGTEKYQWYDGTVLSVPRTSTFASLKSNFGLTITIEVTYGSVSAGAYKIYRKITFTGTKVNAGSSNTFTKTWETTATYTTAANAATGAAASTSTGTRAIKWG
jgi:hypothetical protein